MISILLGTLLLLQPQAAPVELHPAPAFTLKDIRGRTVRLSDFKGKVVLINFWATWCPPCRAEMPELVKLQKEYESQGLQLVGITLPKYKQRSVSKIISQLRINYPILFGTQKTANLFNVDEVLPVTIIIDRSGTVRDRILGIIAPEEFEEKVKRLL